MVAKTRDAKLDTPTARSKLPVRGKPYYRAIGEGLHLGYRKGKTDGKWVARVYTGDGAYVVETIAKADDKADADGEHVLTFYEAQDRAREAQGRLTGKAEAAGPYTVAKALDDYLAALEHDGKPTGDTRNRMDIHIRPAIGEKEVADLTAADIRTWLKSIADAPPRARTGAKAKHVNYRQSADDDDARRRRRASANRTLTVLKAALNLAWRSGKAGDDKEWRSVKPFPQADAARVRYLQVAEARRLINGCEPGFRKMVQAALQTGCRYGELTRLRVEDFNPDAGTLVIRRSKSGKARHVVLTDEGQTFFAQLAAGRRGSDVLLINEARRARAVARAEVERNRRKGRGDKTPVPSGDTGEWRPSEQVRAMAEANIRAKLDPPANFHCLRHTWASHAVMNGVPLIVVARNLGHADTRMVEKHYGHLSQTYVADAIRAGAPRFGIAESNVRAM